MCSENNCTGLFSPSTPRVPEDQQASATSASLHSHLTHDLYFFTKPRNRKSLLKITYDPSILKVKIGGPGVRGQPLPHSEFKARQGSIKPCLKQTKKQSLYCPVCCSYQPYLNAVMGKVTRLSSQPNKESVVISSSLSVSLRVCLQ